MQRTAACRLNPLLSAHSVYLKSVSLGMTPCSVSTLQAGARSEGDAMGAGRGLQGLSTRASSELLSLSARYAWPCVHVCSFHKTRRLS